MQGSDLSRRKLLQAMGTTALSFSLPDAMVPEPVVDGRDTSEMSRIPKIALELSRVGLTLAIGTVDEAGMRRVKQLGVNDVLMGGPPIPWQETDLRSLMERLKSGGLSLGNMMISGFPNTLYGRPGRDSEIDKVQQSIRAAGRAGLPVIEYNFYAHRLVEGYYEEIGRGGAGLTAFDYDRVKNLPPLPQEGAHDLEGMWRNITYFLKAVIPVAEDSGVRLALHPNDPPAPMSRGSRQIMGSVDGWKRLIDIVPSKSNGITFDCGVTRETGPIRCRSAVTSGPGMSSTMFITEMFACSYPNEEYTEVFIDDGMNDMYAVMKELVQQKYSGLIYPEHPRALDYDRERPDFKPYYPGGGGYAGYAYNVGYTRAMLQAALSS